MLTSVYASYFVCLCAIYAGFLHIYAHGCIMGVVAPVRGAGRGIWPAWFRLGRGEGGCLDFFPVLFLLAPVSWLLLTPGVVPGQHVAGGAYLRPWWLLAAPGGIMSGWVAE